MGERETNRTLRRCDRKMISKPKTQKRVLRLGVARSRVRRCPESAADIVEKWGGRGESRCLKVKVFVSPGGKARKNVPPSLGPRVGYGSISEMYA